MFKYFPTLQYGGVTLTDITRRMFIHPDIKNYDSIIQTYAIKDGQNVEDVAYNFYGDGSLFYIIMMMNDIIDPFFGWVLSSEEFQKHIEGIYGAGNLQDIHHYELNGEQVPEETTGAIAISNYLYEFRLNEEKRNIKILKPQYVNRFVEEFRNSIRNEVF